MADGNSELKHTKLIHKDYKRKQEETQRQGGLCPMVDGSPVGQEGICVSEGHDTSWQGQFFTRMISMG